MAHNQLLLQIVTMDGRRIRFAAGNIGDTLERDLVAVCATACANAVAAELASASWMTRMRAKLTPAVLTPVIAKAMASAMDRAIMDLKDDTRYIWANPIILPADDVVDAPLTPPDPPPPPVIP